MPRIGSGFLEQPTTKMTVVLDLDQTLIYACINKLEKAKNYALIDNKYYVYKRPHLDDFLITVN
jgi:TFIIF-interacting CTD phosphatase-like protein